MTKSPWSMSLDGVEYPLIPSITALLTIEDATSRTIYSLIEQVRTDTLSLRDLASVVTCLIGAGLPEKDGGPIAVAYMALQGGLRLGAAGIAGENR